MGQEIYVVGGKYDWEEYAPVAFSFRRHAEIYAKTVRQKVLGASGD